MNKAQRLFQKTGQRAKPHCLFHQDTIFCPSSQLRASDSLPTIRVGQSPPSFGDDRLGELVRWDVPDHVVVVDLRNQKSPVMQKNLGAESLNIGCGCLKAVGHTPAEQSS